MYIVDMLSRAYLLVDHSKHENILEYQIFQLSQEQQLFQEIADINQVDYMHLSEGTHQQIKMCTVADAALRNLMNRQVGHRPKRNFLFATVSTGTTKKS